MENNESFESLFYNLGYSPTDIFCDERMVFKREFESSVSTTTEMIAIFKGVPPNIGKATKTKIVISNPDRRLIERKTVPFMDLEIKALARILNCYNKALVPLQLGEDG